MRRYQRAAQLALSLGKRSPYVEKVGKLSLERVHVYKGKDPLYFTSKALEILLLLRYGDPEELYQYSLTAAQRARNARDYRRARACYDGALKFARWAKNQNEVRATEIAIAESWAEDAVAQETAGSFLVAHDFWEKAVQTYRKLGLKTEAADCRKQMRTAGQKAQQNLKAITFEFDVTELANAARNHVSGLSCERAVCAFSALLPLPPTDELREQTLKSAEQAPLTHLATTVKLNDDGQKVAAAPGMLSGDAEGYELAVRIHMIKNAVRRYGLLTVGALQPAYAVLLKEHFITENEISAFVTTSAFVPSGRAEFFIPALAAGFRGDFITALHILIPQLEHALRRILHDRGVITTALDQEGIEQEWPLGTLLKTPDLEIPLSNNVVFALRSMLTEKNGPNLRNLLLHGLLPPSACKSHVGVFVRWLVLRLVVCCTPQMQEFVRYRQAKAETKNDTPKPKEPKPDGA